MGMCGGEALAGTHSTVPFRRARSTLPSISGPASRKTFLSLFRGKATDCRPEVQRWIICSGRCIALDYYRKDASMGALGSTEKKTLTFQIYESIY